jgi:hypothetical protein
MNHHHLKRDLAGAYPEKSVAVNDVFEKGSAECFSLPPQLLCNERDFEAADD